MSEPEEPIESGLIADIPTSKARHDQVVKLAWEFYSNLPSSETKSMTL
jgi:hypothetical protein